LTSPNQNIGGCVPGIPGGVDASETYRRTDKRTDTVPLRRPCSVYCDGRVNDTNIGPRTEASQRRSTLVASEVHGNRINVEKENRQTDGRTDTILLLTLPAINATNVINILYL